MVTCKVVICVLKTSDVVFGITKCLLQAQVCYENPLQPWFEVCLFPSTFLMEDLVELWRIRHLTVLLG